MVSTKSLAFELCDLQNILDWPKNISSSSNNFLYHQNAYFMRYKCKERNFNNIIRIIVYKGQMVNILRL